MSESTIPGLDAKVPAPWSDEPSCLGVAELLQLLSWAADNDASDLKLTTGERPAARVRGVWCRIAKRRLPQSELESVLVAIYGSHAAALLAGGQPIDFSYQVGTVRSRKLRFRVNATAGSTSDTVNGIDIVFRVIPEHAPSIEDIGLDQAIVDAHREVAQSQGLVLVIGATGTGKSTTLAALVDDITMNYALNVITYEAPIEFNLAARPGARGLVTQTEVPRHVGSFQEGVANALRRAPNVIVVGEARDRETMRGTVTAALTGHAVYTTLHTNSVASGLPRIVGEFPRDEMCGIQGRLVDVIRLMMTQRLVRTIDGSRMALREFLVLDQDMRRELSRVDPDSLQPLVHGWVRDRHQSLLCAAERNRHQLAPGVFELIEAEWKEAAGE